MVGADSIFHAFYAASLQKHISVHRLKNTSRMKCASPEIKAIDNA